MSLNNLRPPKGATHAKKRVGRGPGSGHGKTASRGNKGAQSRSGFSFKRGFEGGQMPLHRRVPKRGFHNPFRVEYEVVNLDTLEARFDAGTVVTLNAIPLAGKSFVSWSGACAGTTPVCALTMNANQSAQATFTK